jgi:hypothetical protein
MATKTTTREIVIEAIGQMSVGVNKTPAILCKLSGETVVALRFSGDGEAVYRELCDACDGTGYRPGYGFIDSGRCWPCNYSGLHGKGRTKEDMDKLFRTRATRERNAAAKAERLAAAAHEAQEARFAALHPVAREVISTILDAVTVDEERSAYYGDLYVTEDAGYPEKLIYQAWSARYREQTTGEIALLVADFKRFNDRAAAQAVRTFMGEEKAKITFTGKVVFTKVIDGIYGSTTLVKFEAADGNVATWFASGIKDVQRDEVYTVTGTVKKLENSEQYGKQTILTRCKLVPVA